MKERKPDFGYHSPSEKSEERNTFMSVPAARRALFDFVHDQGEVSFSELQKWVAANNLYFGGGVTALDVLRSSDRWYEVRVDEAKRRVIALVPVAAAR